MQTLTVDFIMSLDGYGAAEGWPGWWGLEGPEYLGWLEQLPEQDHPILMGATTYRLMSELTAGGEEGTEVLDDVQKYVFSSTLEEPLDWANSVLVREDAVDFVRRLKEESDRPLRTLGSVALCRSLLQGRAGRPLPRRRVPGHHRRDRRGPDLRRLPRRAARPRRGAHLRSAQPAARVRAHRAGGSAAR